MEAMEGSQQRVEVNILLLGARNVGKSGTNTDRFILILDLPFCPSES